MMFGDLNKIVDSFENFERHHVWISKLHLRKFILNMAGIYLGFVGARFTWDNRQGRHDLIRERLDRAIANGLWLERNPQAMVEHLILRNQITTPS